MEKMTTNREVEKKIHTGENKQFEIVKTKQTSTKLKR